MTHFDLVYLRIILLVIIQGDREVMDNVFLVGNGNLS